MKLLDTILSKIDKTIKYIFLLNDGLIMEMSYIDNNTDKDIICVSSQTACAMGCKFCHTTDYIGQLKIRNITISEITSGIQLLMDQQPILWENKRMLLISYMGCGEPLLNAINVFESLYAVKLNFKKVRFAIATILPKDDWENFFFLTNRISKYEVPVKMHLSLHFPFDNIRSKWMPKALNIKSALAAMNFYKKTAGNVEIYYTPIKGINNKPEDIHELANLLSTYRIPIKFLKFNEKSTLEAKQGSIDTHELEEYGLPYEFYTPPGLDVGASCGQFLFDYYYLKYNTK